MKISSKFENKKKELNFNISILITLNKNRIKKDNKQKGIGQGLFIEQVSIPIVCYRKNFDSRFLPYKYIYKAESERHLNWPWNRMYIFLKEKNGSY